nr:right-handed parallel beta-helix repeat-containing protein [Candidatus Sigynarchaeota archaeon]
MPNRHIQRSDLLLDEQQVLQFYDSVNEWTEVSRVYSCFCERDNNPMSFDRFLVIVNKLADNNHIDVLRRAGPPHDLIPEAKNKPVGEHAKGKGTSRTVTGDVARARAYAIKHPAAWRHDPYETHAGRIKRACAFIVPVTIMLLVGGIVINQFAGSRSIVSGDIPSAPGREYGWTSVKQNIGTVTRVTSNPVNGSCVIIANQFFDCTNNTIGLLVSNVSVPVVIENCTFFSQMKRPGSSGIFVQNATNVTIKNCFVRQFEWGISFTNTYGYFLVDHSTIDRCDRGIVAEVVGGLTIQNCIVTDISDTGMWISMNLSPIIVS